MVDLIDVQSYEAGYTADIPKQNQKATRKAIKLLDGNATIALLTVPLGLILIFSKENGGWIIITLKMKQMKGEKDEY